MKSWLEDSVPQDLYEEMEKTASQYTSLNEAQKVADFYDGFFQERINELALAMSQEEKRNAMKEPEWSGYDDPIRKQKLK